MIKTMLSINDCIEEGQFALQDFESNDVEIKFHGSSLGYISQMHANILRRERQIKELQTPKLRTNFLLLQIGIYGNRDGTLFKKCLDLHELVNESSGTIVFPSSFEADLSNCCRGCLCINLPEDERMFEFYERNVAFRGQKCPGINRKIFDDLQTKVRESNDKIQGQRDILRRECMAYATATTHEARIGIEELMRRSLGSIEKGVSTRKEQLKKFVRQFWHSEARMLCYVFDHCETIGQKIREECDGVNIDAVVLHAHSTFCVCDNCRLQLTGAMHNWMHHRIIDSLKKGVERTMKVHIVVSWREKPGNKIDYVKLNTDGGILNLDEVASIRDTCDALSRETKPYVSIVRLS